MKIKILTVGPIETNCYIVVCPQTKEAVIIDPGDEGGKIVEAISSLDINVKYIINTHGHHDHIQANKEVKEATNAQILIHASDAQMLTNPLKNLSHYLGLKTTEPAADRQLQDGDSIEFGNIVFKVLHTPGHTPGCICLYNEAEKICFTGDTLFNGSVGRTDLPGGNYKTLMNSLREKLVNLPNDVVIYPGHGPKSTIREEKAINPFLK
ncbi:MAG: hydroxyacylglutathione hydrolase [Clostridia bacterium]|jgi:glyoxylase-like metal-dependent hydrolase (beta-lactamase superfamily II)|nr:hydroxyacylglutathione hydrolase [Clostridia bacterium]MDN5323191.1 hydroxyacylglutathione hydrolase [Clostridia bacterium]